MNVRGEELIIIKIAWEISRPLFNSDEGRRIDEQSDVKRCSSVYYASFYTMHMLDSKHINSAGKRILLHLSFFSPLIPLLLWIPPLTDHISRSLTVLMHSTFVAKNPIWLVGTTTALELFTVHLATIHLLSCVLVVLLRIGTVRWNLQTYLSAAQDKLDRFSKEPGRTSNREVQRLVASVFYCLNLVALQLVAPTILLLALVCLLKSVAGIAWLPTHCVKHDSVSVSTDPLNAYNYSVPSILDSSSSQYSWSATIIQARFAFTQITSNLGARGSVVARGVLRFLVWWCLFALQAVNLLGFAYHRFTADE
ncbi:unnamed protein product [Calicophoron daubneyi]|uniref:Uncharacterized protein n=1 Tax=Calicophoron daubneyi TaxID=300641 RepID=A0AAV2TRT0_CALDB